MGILEDLRRIEAQEEALVLRCLDADVAWELGATVRDLAVERGLTVVIDIRRVGQPLFVTALDGTTADHAEWIRRKSNVALRFEKSSYAVGLRLKEKGESLTSQQGLELKDYATHGGAFPLRVRGAGVVAVLTVSGLPQRADHELAVEALCVYLGQSYADLRLDGE